MRAMQSLMLYRLWTGPARWLLVAAGVLLVVLFALEFVAYGRLSSVGIGVVLGLPLVFLIVVYWMAPMMGRRQYRQSALLRAEGTVSWDDEALTFESDRGHARIPFGEFHRWGESADLVMLYQTEMFFNLLPKAPLGGAAEDLKARLTAAGVKRA